MTSVTAWSSAAATAAKFCKNSSAVGLSPSTISVTAFKNIAGTFRRSATYATAAPWNKGKISEMKSLEKNLALQEDRN